MKILLDNCVDIHAKTLFLDHQVQHVLDLGWDALSNGNLLAAAAEAHFDAMVTVDKNLRYQQNLDKLPLPVIELDVLKNRIAEIIKFAPFIPQAISLAAKFRFVGVKSDGAMECLAERTAAPSPSQRDRDPER